MKNYSVRWYSKSYIKIAKGIFSCFTSANFDNALNKGFFPDELNRADIKLPNLSKIFECCIYDQLDDYFDKILSKYQCEFRKRFSTQHCLLAIIEKLQKILWEWGEFSCYFNWSKVFECLPHVLTVAKLLAYSVKEGSLKFLLNYFKIRKQKVPPNNTCSFYEISFCSFMTSCSNLRGRQDPILCLFKYSKSKCSN